MTKSRGVILMKNFAAVLLAVFLIASSVAAQERFAVHPATQAPAVRVDLAQLGEWEKDRSNWGRWGPDDQIGT